MKRAIALLLCLLMTAATVSGCAKKPQATVPTESAAPTEPQEITAPPRQDQPEQQLTMVYYPDRSLNPFASTDFTNRALFSLLYQGLFSVDRDYKVEPVLCGRYTMSEDMKIYTFYPASAVFSDGLPLTAADIAASLQAAQESPWYQGRFLHVESIALSGDGGVTVTLDTAYENLPLLLDIPIVRAAQTAAAYPSGTGPYEYASSGGELRLHRKENWWCQADTAVTATEITLLKAESNAYIRDQFEFYDVGLVCTDPCSDTYADYRCDYELWDCENGIFLYLGCNMNSKVFGNADVRKALTYAIDRNTLSTDYYRGFGRSASLPVSPISPWYSEGLAAQYEYNSALFTQALVSAKLKGSAVTLLVNRDDTLRLRAARAIGEMLTACGLKVTVSDLSTSAYQRAYKNGEYDLYLGQTRLSPNMDLTPFFAPDGGLSYNGFSDGAIYAICLQALENSGNYYDLCKMVMDDGRLCPVLFGCYAVYADRGLISGLEPSRDNVFHYSLGLNLADVLDTGETTPTDPTDPTGSTDGTE